MVWAQIDKVMFPPTMCICTCSTQTFVWFFKEMFKLKGQTCSLMECTRTLAGLTPAECLIYFGIQLNV